MTSRWPASLLTVPLLGATMFGAVTGRWWTFSPGYSEATGYEDLRWMARWAECLNAGAYQELIRDCDIAYPLPSVWLAAKLQFTQQDLVLVGAVLAVIWALAASFLILSITKRAGFAWGALVAASLCAPPTWLLLERGNLDLVVWILTLLALGALLKRRDGAASTLIALATLLKIFPSGLSLGLVLAARLNLRRVALLLLAPTLSAIAVVSTGRYVSSLRPNPVGDAFAGFHGPYLVRVTLLRWQGMEVTPSSVTTQVIPATVDYALGIGVFLLGTAIVWYAIFRKVHVDPEGNEFPWLMSALGLILFAYLTGANFDYRLTFFSFVVAGIAIAYPRLQAGTARRCIAVATVGLAVSTWLSVGNPLAIQLLGDGVIWLSLITVSALVIQVVIVAWQSRVKRSDVELPP